MSDGAKTIEFRFERRIPASPEELFDAWLDPAFPGNPWSDSEKCILEPRIDGFFFWRVTGTSHYGRFLEVARPGRISQTWVSPYTLGLESTVTVSFEAKGGETLMTLVHAGLPDHDMGREHEEGWNYFLGTFTARFAKEKAEAHRR